MKRRASILFCLLLIRAVGSAQSVKKYVVNPKDSISGYYLALEPNFDVKREYISGVLVLLSGFSQHVESIFPETKLPNVAYANNMLTICFAPGYKLYADEETQARLTVVLKDVLKRYKVSPQKFVFGGYSAGGNVALRYVELCNEFPDKFPVRPAGVFMVDAPIDLFVIWDMMQDAIKSNFSDAAVSEANEATSRMKSQFGIPTENVSAYAKVNPFSMNKAYGDNEKFLKGTPVRAYHDVDIAWRLINRRQTVHNSNYEVTSELINRLLIMGNKKAEFIQSQKKGYRSNGQRHPHSWSIVDEVECMQWIKGIL